jgi:hypothetical protein
MVNVPLQVPNGLLCPEGCNVASYSAALSTLLSYSMVTLGSAGNFVLNRVVQRAVRASLTYNNTSKMHHQGTQHLMAVA